MEGWCSSAAVTFVEARSLDVGRSDSAVAPHVTKEVPRSQGATKRTRTSSSGAKAAEGNDLIGFQAEALAPDPAVAVAIVLTIRHGSREARVEAEALDAALARGERARSGLTSAASASVQPSS